MAKKRHVEVSPAWTVTDGCEERLGDRRLAAPGRRCWCRFLLSFSKSATNSAKETATRISKTN